MGFSSRYRWRPGLQWRGVTGRAADVVIVWGRRLLVAAPLPRALRRQALPVPIPCIAQDLSLNDPGNATLADRAGRRVAPGARCSSRPGWGALRRMRCAYPAYVYLLPPADAPFRAGGRCAGCAVLVRPTSWSGLPFLPGWGALRRMRGAYPAYLLVRATLPSGLGGRCAGCAVLVAYPPFQALRRMRCAYPAYLLVRPTSVASASP